jgi:hypothetical protein
MTYFYVSDFLLNWYKHNYEILHYTVNHNYNYRLNARNPIAINEVSQNMRQAAATNLHRPGLSLKNLSPISTPSN